MKGVGVVVEAGRVINFSSERLWLSNINKTSIYEFQWYRRGYNVQVLSQFFGSESEI